MGKPTGFLEFERRDHANAPVKERLKHYREFAVPLPSDELRRQGARCMDCGTPYCHFACPVNNIIPDWNDLVYEGDMQRALEVLHSTNNFPDFTGRICPAPCEAACTLNLIESPVTIKTIEYAIAERGWEAGWVAPHRQARGDRRLRSGGARLRTAAGSRRARSRRLRKIAAGRRAVAHRHSRFQARKARRRTPHRTDARRRRRIPRQHPCRAYPPGGRADAGQ